MIVTLHFFRLDGSCKTVQASAGETLFDVAVKHGVQGIIGECGGSCLCATCHCYIDTECELPAPGKEERRFLRSVVAPAPESRLACQIVVTDDLDGANIRVPLSQYF